MKLTSHSHPPKNPTNTTRHTTPQWWSTIAAAKLPNFQHGKVLFPFPLLKLVPYRANLFRRTQVGSMFIYICVCTVCMKRLEVRAVFPSGDSPPPLPASPPPSLSHTHPHT